MLIPFQTDTGESFYYRQERPLVTYLLLIAYVVIHVSVSAVLSRTEQWDLIYRFAAVKFEFHWWSPLTCTFLHAGWLHLCANLYFLWLFGRDVECYVGSIPFLLLYTTGAYLSIGIHLLTLSSFFVDIPTIGASGAISAVLGTFLVLWPTANLRSALFTFLSWRPLLFPLPAYFILGLWFLGQLLYSLRLTGHTENVAFWAHLGGFVAGAGMGTLFKQLHRRRLARLDRAAKQPLTDAWAEFLAGDAATAESAAALLDERLIQDASAHCEFIRGLSTLKNNRERDALTHLLRAFCRARDYHCDPATVAVYLQIIKYVNSKDIPPFVHKDAGHAAYALKHRHFALQAYKAAVTAGCEKGLQPVLHTVETAKRKRLI